MKNYEPELGQMLFGQPSKKYECSPELYAAMAFLAELMPEMENPFSNSGHRGDYGAFQAHAYSWSDEEQPWNFKWRDVEVSWYKYHGRGMSVNREVSRGDVIEMMAECVRCIPK